MYKYEIAWDAVIGEILQAPQPIKEAFVAIVESLAENPLSRSLGVLPLKFGAAMYTVRFDDALLVFQVMADYPLVQLLHIAWNAPPNGGGPVEAPGRLT